MRRTMGIGAFLRREDSSLRTSRRLRLRRRFVFTAEGLEPRQLLSTGQFVQGTAYVDVNSDGQLDAGDTYLAGATINVYTQNGATLVASKITDANGAYLIDGLQAGVTYQIVELPPSGFKNSSAQALVQVDTATVLGPDKIETTLAPTPQTITLTSLGTGIIDHVIIDGAPTVEWLGQLDITSTLTAGGGTTAFTSNCVDLFHDVGGDPFGAQILPTSAALLGPKADEIAYLYNHYGKMALSQTQASGLQLAIWKSEYDGTLDFTTGRITMPLSPPPNLLYDPNVVPAALAFMTEAAGKHEMALFLDAIQSPVTQGQSMLATRSFNFANTPGNTLRTGDTATIGFWANKNGQALINSFNGGPTSTALANWLSSSFPNLYGATAGSNNLVGKTNAQVATYFQSLFSVKGQKVYAQVLANALAVYATTLSLGGTAAIPYGFNVTVAGTGAATFNIGTNGEAFGVPNGTTLSVFQILTILNAKAKNGILFFGAANQQTLINEANVVCDGINEAGDIL